MPIIVCATLILLLVALGGRELSLSEARRLALADDIMRNGRWFIPYMIDAPYRYFPPLNPWTIVIASWPVGTLSLLAARLVSVAAGVGLLLITYRMAKEIVGRRTAWLAAAMIATNILFFSYARQARPEIPLALFVALSYWGFWKAYVAKNRSHAAPWLFFAGMVLAGYTKGWAFMYYMGLGLTLYSILSNDRDFLRKVSFHLAVFGAIAAVGVWFYFAVTHMGSAPVLEGLRQNTLEKLLGKGFQPLNVLKSAGVILASSFPWTIPAVWGLFSAARRRKEAKDGGRLLCFSWAAACMGAYCLLMESHDRYLIAAWAPLMILGALELKKLFEAEGCAWKVWRGFATVLVVLDAATIIAVPFIARFVFGITNSLPMILAMLPLAIVFPGAARALPRGTIRGVNLAVASCTGAMLLIVVLLQAAAPDGRPYEKAAVAFNSRFAARRDVTSFQSVALRLRMQYYLDRTISTVRKTDRLHQWLEDHPEGVVLTYKRKLKRLDPLADYKIIMLQEGGLPSKDHICAVVREKKGTGR